MKRDRLAPPNVRQEITREFKRHTLSAAALIIAGTLLAGCAGSPADVLKKMEEAAAAGDARTFADCFTRESRPFAEALVMLQKSRGGERDGRKSPIELLSGSKVLSERIDGDRAVVTISAAGTRSDLVFTRENGSWKLNVSETESGRRAEPGVIP